jgi:hypothetical protein
MKRKKFKKIMKEIRKQLKSVEYSGDISDIGNEIGIVLGKHIKDDNLDLRLFTFGIKHGVSLSNGTHP